MEKNLKYEVLESVMYVNTKGLVAHIDRKRLRIYTIVAFSFVRTFAP